MKKLRPDAILFDMDGVLVDSINSWWMSLNAALKKYKHKELSREEFIKKYWGYDLNTNLEKMDVEPEVLQFCNNTYVNYLDHVEIYTDTKDTLKKFKNYKKSIITNTPKSCTNHILGKLDLGSYFDVIMTSDQVSMGKPSPEMIHKACKKLNVDAKRCVLIGDTSSDVKAGEAAGCIVIGIRIDADYRIESLSELVSIIELKE